jgi:16S rRNA (cytosine1402-N4)-methyltransferase
MNRTPSASLDRAPPSHRSVMLAEVLQILAPRDGAIYVDGTFGAGGYARGLLEAAKCHVWGIDRDPEAIARGRELQINFPGRIDLVSGRFSEMDRLLSTRGIVAVDGVALDLGVSSPQIDDPARGFSFRHDGPLDMRMERQGASAADAVNRLEEHELADIIFRYGEEKQARRIARAIVRRRDERPIARTLELAEIVRRVVDRTGDAVDPATRTFQALRIHVNDELGELDRGLRAAERLLTRGGRLAVVAFHSLEDRAVKTFLRKRSGGEDRGSRHLPQPVAGRATPTFELIQKRAMRPSAAEIAENPRARSARLRAAMRTAASPWPEDRAA